MEKEKISNISWVLVGVRPNTSEPASEETVQKMLMEAFLPGKIYKLFLCGVEVDKEGNLEEMEEGFLMLKSKMEEYNDGDYCIISQHEEGNLLFLPTIIDDDVKDFSGNIDTVQE